MRKSFSEWLVLKGACAEARAWCGDRTLAAAWAECPRGAWLEWLLGTLGVELDAPAEAEYQRVAAPALGEYRRVRDAALAEHERVRASAWAEYQRACDAAEAEYERVVAPARAEYARVIAPAWAEYERVRADAYRAAVPFKKVEEAFDSDMGAPL